MALPGALGRYCLGVAFVGVGLALALRARLGLGPLNVLQDGLAATLGVTVGAAVTLVGLVLLTAAAVIGQRPGLGTIISAFGAGAVVDASLSVVPPLGSIPIQATALLAALAAMVLGGAICVGSGIGMSPVDSLMVAVTERTPWRSVAIVRTAIESTALVAGWALGGRAGAGTLVIGLGIGPGIATIMRRCGPRPTPKPKALHRT